MTNAMDVWQGKKNAIVHTFVNFDAPLLDQPLTTEIYSLFTTKLPALWSTGHVPMVTWSPTFPNPDEHPTPPDIARQINGGRFGSYIRNWALLMKRFLAGPDLIYGDGDDRRVYIRFAHEPNLFGQPFAQNSNSNQTAGEYREMWQTVRDHFATQFTQPAVDRYRIQWVWSVNWFDKSGPLMGQEVTMESLYPGNHLVDWVGLDTYDAAPSAFCGMVDRLRAVAPGKPIGINEWGYNSNQFTPTQKDANIAAFFDWVHENEMGMVVAFNSEFDGDEDGTNEFDGRVFDFAGGGGFPERWPSNDVGPFGVFPGYRTKSQAPWVTGSVLTDLRLITNEAFAGE